MSNVENLSLSQHTKILVPAEGYNLSADTRLLIPFTSGDKIGFVNRNGEIVVKPLFAMYYGECYCMEDFIRVSIIETYGYPRSGGKVSTYQRPLYGLINYKGEILLEAEYMVMIPAIGNNNLFTVQKDYEYGVVNASGKEIIPFGTYVWIDGFDRGLARVKKGDKWGLIDESGAIVLPVEYNSIWNFYGKPKYSSVVVTKNNGMNTILKDFLVNKGKTTKVNGNSYHNNQYYDYNYKCGNTYRCEHYEEFSGTYAQDEAGYSDEDIYDAFEGDPDAYWNID